MTLQPNNYKALGQQAAQANGIPWNIFNALVHQESGWDPTAKSPVGAIGFGQLMPGTAKGLGVNPSDPAQNLVGAAKYLRMQYQKFGRWDLALAAYNAGPAAVSKYGGIPPYAETQNYVKNIMGAALAGDKPGVPPNGTGKPSPGVAGLPPIGGAPDVPTVPGIWGSSGKASTPLQGLLDFAGPQPGAVQQLGSLGGTAQKFAQGALKPIDPGAQIPGLAQPQGSQPTQTQEDPYRPNVIPTTKYMNGRAPMVTGGNIAAKYPNLSAQSHVDWEHINPRLLNVLQKEAEKRGVAIVLTSGYRDNAYSMANGGFANDPHTHGVAVDAYVNGHPIGDVIGPEEWAKLGVRSGNTPGFYKGKTDPEHLDLIGIPIKGGPKA